MPQLISILLCIFLNGISIVILSIVSLSIQKQIREIRHQNIMIEHQKGMLDMLTNFRDNHHYCEIDLGEKND